ncbi:MAG: MATE family efflux transporter [Oculatellaceae cyanobacterium bins.114]|nr:MATE family efflux transporter [Oculatellaceae cyanobacterium bins.114]
MITKGINLSIFGLPVEVKTEIRAFLRLAMPLATAQVAQTAVGFVDTVMMGQLGSESLAAGGLAATTFQLLLNVTSGVVMAVSPLVAEAYGAGRKAQIESIARQGLWLSALLSIPLMVVFAHLDTVLLILKQPAAIATLADPYFKCILWGVFPALGFAMLRGYVSALAQAHVVISIVIVGTLFNGLGNYALGFGHFGFPRLELAGLGLSSALSFWGMFVIFLIYVVRHPQLKQYRLLHNLHCLRPQLLQRLITIGGAIAMTITLEYGLFAVITFLVGTLGTDVLAAHQTVYQTTYLIFMVPLGMSYAVTARVGQWWGKRDLAGVKRAAYVGIAVSAAFMLLMAIALIVYRQPVIGLFLDTQAPDDAHVIALAIPMLVIGAISQLLDGVQRVAMGALYGLQDSRVPMILSAVAFWGVGLTGGYLLGFPLGFAGAGLWTGQSIGVAIAAIVFVWRFHRLTNK